MNFPHPHGHNSLINPNFLGAVLPRCPRTAISAKIVGAGTLFLRPWGCDIITDGGNNVTTL